MDGWMDGWVETGKAGLRIAYSNQKAIAQESVDGWMGGLKAILN